MGGDILVESIVEGGSTFSFEISLEAIPAAEVNDRQEIRQIEIVMPESNRSQPKILIADDRQLNRELLIELLEPMGFCDSLRQLTAEKRSPNGKPGSLT